MAVTTNFSFTKLVGTDYAGYSTINVLIDSIDSILNARIPASATAASVIGRSAATAGATAAIAATSDGQVLRRASGIVGFGTIPQSSISDFVFTTEAARDAAITSPTEGMRAYITASTVAAATGTVTMVPTGIQTIYNGSVWVCVTPVSAQSYTTASTTSTSFVTKLTGDATAISVTLVTGTTAEIKIHGAFTVSVANVSATIGFKVNAASVVANDGVRIDYPSTNSAFHGRSGVFTGLTAGTNTFTLAYTTSSNTLTYYGRHLTVSGVA